MILIPSQFVNLAMQKFIGGKMALNRYSLKKIAEMQAEAPIRMELCKRAGGTPVTTEVQIYRNGQRYTYTKVECKSGVCEICGKPTYQLEPHESPPRSKGTTVSMKFSKMVCRNCHIKAHNNYPKWSSHV